MKLAVAAFFLLGSSAAALATYSVWADEPPPLIVPTPEPTPIDSPVLMELKREIEEARRINEEVKAKVDRLSGRFETPPTDAVSAPAKPK